LESYDSTKITAAQYIELTRVVGLTENQVAEALIKNLIEARRQARATKDFNTADAIRAIATASGVTLMDNPDGTTTWSRK